MSRILFFGDLAPTGFGTVTTDLGSALLALGEDVRFVSQNDLGADLVEPFSSRTVDLTTFVVARDARTGQAGVAGLTAGLGALFDGTSKVKMHNGSPMGDWKPDASVVLGDFHSARRILGTVGDVPLFHYVPIEGVGLPRRWGEFWKIAKPIAMSRFGAQQIQQVVGYEPPMVYHGVNADAFYPVSSKRPVILKVPDLQPLKLTSRDECKQAWVGMLAEANGVERIPRHWILRTDRLMPRKRYPSLIRALAPALAAHPDWALVMHCMITDQGGDLRDEISKYPPQMRNQLLFTNLGFQLSRELLVSLYNAADLYASVSAEGFGLTIAEALACGVPVVGAGHSAVPEVIGPAGVVVEEGGLIDNEYNHFWWAVEEQAFGRACEHLMTHQTKRQELGRKGPPHIRSSFRWDAAARQFVDLIHSAVAPEVAA